MGVTLGRTAYSPNIKERRDFSCACFLADGQMIAQAAHIPVHLGAMPASVRAALDAFDAWAPGDLVVLNDPYLGGTHLPDITMVSPVFVDAEPESPPFFVASRAHHADVGGMSPGSMPLATEIYQEGLIIPPVKLVEAGRTNQAVLDIILRNVRTPVERRGDLAAQMAAHRVGEQRLQEIVARYGLDETLRYARGLLAYAERLTRAAIARIPDGVYTFCRRHGRRGNADKRDHRLQPAQQPLGPQDPGRGDGRGRRHDRRLYRLQPGGGGAAQRRAGHHRVGDLVRGALRGRGRRAGQQRDLCPGARRRAPGQLAGRRSAPRRGRRQRRDLAADRGRGAGRAGPGAARLDPGGQPGHDEQPDRRRPRSRARRALCLL